MQQLGWMNTTVTGISYLLGLLLDWLQYYNTAMFIVEHLQQNNIYNMKEQRL